MMENEKTGKRQHIATRKRPAAKSFSEEELRQHEIRRETWVPRQDNDFKRQSGRFNHDSERDGDSPRRRRDRDEDRPFSRERRSSDRPRRRNNDEERPFSRESKFANRPRRRDDSEEKPFSRERRSSDRPRRRDNDEERPFSRERKFTDRPRRRDDSEERPFNRERRFSDRQRNNDDYEETSFSLERRQENRRGRGDSDKEPVRTGRRGYQREKDERYDRPKATGDIRLNKYLADSGICSRREADDLIQAGCVTVNGVVVTELGTKVKTTDKVVYGGQTLNREKLRYVLLNKPKGVITTSDDPYERHTVMDLVEGACEERIYPVGRLDRNTLGLLLLTNDGELAKTLTHPSHEVKKLYHVTLNKPLTKNDLEAISNGIELDDGPITVDDIKWVADDLTKREVGVEIHSGRNHIVRRIFEHFGYEVVKLDRVMFAGLTKYMLPRGHWRFLTPAEVSMLKQIK